MHADSTRLNELSGLVIGCAFTALNTLGAGFLEKVYENALAYEIRALGLLASQQFSITVHHHNIVVGEYGADLPVENLLLVELKAVRALDAVHMMQCTNYLKATRRPLCLLLNFGNPRLEIKRVANGI